LITAVSSLDFGAQLVEKPRLPINCHPQPTSRSINRSRLLIDVAEVARNVSRTSLSEEEATSR
jgi:hypothetical protein